MNDMRQKIEDDIQEFFDQCYQGTPSPEQRCQVKAAICAGMLLGIGNLSICVNERSMSAKELLDVIATMGQECSLELLSMEQERGGGMT